MPTFSPYSPPDAIIEAALRNDACRGLPPRYSTASVTPIQATAETDQSRLEVRIERMHAALRELTDRARDQADLMERLARRNLRGGLDVRTVNAVRDRFLHAEVQLAAAQSDVLDADSDLDMLDIDHVGVAMRAALHRLTATDLSAKTDAEEHGLGASDLLGRRAG